MRALSLWQPWASAMAMGIKKNETRGWPTGYRGDMVICSAKRKPTPQEIPDPDTYRAAMAVPYGCALCIVEIYDCVRTEVFDPTRTANFLPLTEQERQYGDYTPGRFAWLTRNLRPLATPVPVIGRQGLFILPDDVAAKIMEQLANQNMNHQQMNL